MILLEINKELDEIWSLVKQLSKTRDHAVITADVGNRILNIRTMANEQHLLLNARLSISHSQQVSFADIVKQAPFTAPGNVSTPKVPETLYSLTVTSKDQNATSQDTINQLKKNVRPEKIGARVSNVKPASKGRVIIVVNDKLSAEKLENAINKNKDLECKHNKKQNPYMRVLNVPPDVTDEDLLNAFGETEPGSVRIAFQNRSKGSDRRHVTVQTVPKLWLQYVSEKRINVAWQRLTIVPTLPIQRCFRCQEFGHSSNKCIETRSICSWCTRFHDIKDCQSNNESGRCINCVRSNSKHDTNFNTNHPANSRDCCVFKIHKQRVINNTEYNDAI